MAHVQMWWANRLCTVAAGVASVGVLLPSASAVDVTLESSNLGLTSQLVSAAYDASTGAYGIDVESIASIPSTPGVSVTRGPNAVTAGTDLGSVFSPDVWSASVQMTRGPQPAPGNIALTSSSWRMVFRMNEDKNITLNGRMEVLQQPTNNMSIAVSLFDVTSSDDFTPANALVLMSESNDGQGFGDLLILGSGAGESSVFFGRTRTATLEAGRRYFLEFNWQAAPTDGQTDNGQPFIAANGLVTFSAVPEPATLGLLAGAGLMLVRRKR